MSGERTVTVEVDGGGTMAIVAEPVGETPVAATSIVAKLGTITSTIERVSYDMLDAVRGAGPSEPTVEPGFELAVEAGQVVALFGKGMARPASRPPLSGLEIRADPAGEDGEPRTPKPASADL